MSEDPAFCDDPWISAVAHLRDTARLMQTPRDWVLSVELDIILNCLNHLDIVRKVIAIIDEYDCTYEGDAMVVLKDPRGRIGGYIQKEACLHGSFGPDLRVGSVVVLSNVQVVVGTGYTYLNIKLENIDAIWTKENCIPPNNSDEDISNINGDSYVEDTNSDESYTAYGTLKDTPSGSGDEK